MSSPTDDHVDGTTVSSVLLGAEPQSVRTARAFTLTKISAHASDDEAGDDFLTAAATVTSELVTNALNAGASLIRLTVTVGPDTVLISVIDDASGEVATAAHDPLALRGRGLRMVESMSQRWGVADDPDGKRVWAELAHTGTTETGTTTTGTTTPPRPETNEETV